VTARTVTAIWSRGLTLTHDGMTTVAPPEATTRLDRPVGLLVVAVKAYDLDAALDRVEPQALDGALVLPLLNGPEHVDPLPARFDGTSYRLVQAPPAVAAGSIASLSAHAPEPGFVVQGTPSP